MIRKKLHWLFYKFEFKLDIQTNFEIIEILDITPNWNNNEYPHLEKKKNNQHLRYINTGSSEPKQLFKHISNGIMTRLSTLIFSFKTNMTMK